MAEAEKFRAPVHPAFTHFPAALWTTGVVFDICSFWLGNTFVRAAFYVLFAGCVMAFPAALAGVWDFTKLKTGTEAKKEATIHGLVMFVVTLFFVMNTWARGMQVRAPHTSVPLFVMAILGLAGMAAGAWMGHRLIYRFGANVMQPKTARTDFRERARPQIPVRP